MVTSKEVLIASDHAGLALKKSLIEQLTEWSWDDLGATDLLKKVDYPDCAEHVARKIQTGEYLQGVLICGTGVGVCIAANRFPGVRAALATNPVVARLSREHNNANVLCLGARFTASDYALEITQAWLKAKFSDDSRHRLRLQKIRSFELELQQK